MNASVSDGAEQTMDSEYVAIRKSVIDREAPEGILGDWLEERGHPEAAILARFRKLGWSGYLLRYGTSGDRGHLHTSILVIARTLLAWDADPGTCDVSAMGPSLHRDRVPTREVAVGYTKIYLYDRHHGRHARDY